MANRWNKKEGVFRENQRIDAFLKEVSSVCRKHGFYIGHEDTNGAFIIHPLDEEALAWLEDAMDGTDGLPHA